MSLSYRKIVYRSELEIETAKQFYALGVRFKYEPFKLEYLGRVYRGVCRECASKNVAKIRHYIPDFVIGNMIIEVKGNFRASDRSKMLSVREHNPKFDVRFVFSRNNKLTRTSKLRYSDWCVKHGFAYTFKEVPKEWFKNVK